MTACHYARRFLLLAALLLIAYTWMGVNATKNNPSITSTTASSKRSINHHHSAVRLHNTNDNATQPHGYEIVEEKVVYSGWRSIIQRLVRMPNGKLVTFDIVGQRGTDIAVIIFAWNTQTKTATLVREYNPACHFLQTGLAAGMVEHGDDKHDSDPFIAAQHELEEECHLAGGTWFLLTSPTGLAMDKYASTKLRAYLVLDAQHVHEPKPLDDEEDIEIVHNVPVEEIFRMIKKGEMNVVGSFASLLALEKLRELNELP